MWSTMSSYLNYAVGVSSKYSSTHGQASQELGSNSLHVNANSPSTTTYKPLHGISELSPETTSRALTQTSLVDLSTRAPKTSSQHDILILRGIIVGQEHTGKTSLIRRLRGDDPLQKAASSTRNLMALIPWKSKQRDISSSSSPSTRSINSSSIIMETEELVQLYITETKSFSSPNKDEFKSVDYQSRFCKEWKMVLNQHKKKLSGTDLDFVVWMIDGRDDHAIELISCGLEILFPFCEKIQSNEKVEDFIEVKDNGKNNEKLYSAPIQNLCILLNFRDLQSHHEPTKKDKHPNNVETTLLDQVRDMAQSVLSRNSHRTSSNPQPTILVYESSMKNGYGLQQLYSFITLPYLFRKEQEYLRCAESAAKEHVKMRNKLIDCKDVHYEQFVVKSSDQLIMQKSVLESEFQKPTISVEENQTGSIPTQNHTQSDKKELPAEVVKQGTSDGSENDSNHSTHIHTKHLRESDADMSMTESDGEFVESFQPFFSEMTPHRQLLPSSSLRVIDHNNLDSFFSEDEDEDEVKSTSVRNDSSTKERVSRESMQPSLVSKSSDVSGNEDSTSDDENSDDDFFIDSNGHRFAHATTSNETILNEKKGINNKNSTYCQDHADSDNIDLAPVHASVENPYGIKDQRSIEPNNCSAVSKIKDLEGEVDTENTVEEEENESSIDNLSHEPCDSKGSSELNESLRGDDSKSSQIDYQTDQHDNTFKEIQCKETDQTLGAASLELQCDITKQSKVIPTFAPQYSLMQKNSSGVLDVVTKVELIGMTNETQAFETSVRVDSASVSPSNNAQLTVKSDSLFLSPTILDSDDDSIHASRSDFVKCAMNDDSDDEIRLCSSPEDQIVEHPMATTLVKKVHNDPISTKKSLEVSDAARAAIEEARLIAEAMLMSHTGNSSIVSNNTVIDRDEKRKKKEVKRRSGKSKKSKKKEK